MPVHAEAERDERGIVAILVAVAFLPLALTLAIVADAGRVWTAEQRLQNAVEATAAASARDWAAGGATCSATALEFLRADGAEPTAQSCSATGTRTAGVVSVEATEQVGLMFAGLVGRSTSTVRASTGVRVGAAAALTGVWPFALCADNRDIASWIAAGFPAGHTVTITFQQPNQLCGGSISGNWSILDFDGGSVSNSETQGWITNGYTGVVTVGDVLNGSPGAPSTSFDLASVVGKTITMPIYRYPRLNGSNAEHTIVGFARAVVVAARFTGAAAQRSITVTFTTGSSSGAASELGGGNFGLITWSVCSFDSHGVCT
jgi:hypothetical protein